MEKYEPIVRTYYDALEEGKILALKCEDCKTIQYPPIPVCAECYSTNMKWIELSRKAVLLHGGAEADHRLWPHLKQYAPCRWGEVQLEEGVCLSAMIINYGDDDATINAKCPIPLEMVIIQDDGFKTTAFRVVEQSV